MFGGLMRRVAGQISYRAVRNHGTIGGSVALADPAADWPACLLALGAIVRIAGRNGVRIELVADFVQGPLRTSLATGEIIIGFDVPAPGAPLRWGFAKVARKSGAFAKSIAIAVAQGDDGPRRSCSAPPAPRPRMLPTVATQLPRQRAPRTSLRAAIAADLAPNCTDADAYQKRLHTATILRAVREMRGHDRRQPRVERRDRRRRRRAAADARRLHARALRADRDASRLRARRLRRLHGAWSTARRRAPA